MKLKKNTIIIVLFIITVNIFGQSTLTEIGLKARINYSKYTPNFEVNDIKVVDHNGKLCL